jgi:hypothetical protein
VDIRQECVWCDGQNGTGFHHSAALVLPSLPNATDGEQRIVIHADVETP